METCLLFTRLSALFSEHADSDRAMYQQRYMKSGLPFWGIPCADVKKISNVIFKDFVPKNNKQYRDVFLYIFKNAERREEWYAAMHYAIKFKKFISEENIDAYLKIVNLTQWWDIVDTVSVHLFGKALLDNVNLEKHLRKWIVDENMWVRRVALLTQLKYKDKTDVDLLSDLILTVADEKEFFIRKAIGWVLREYSYTDPKWVKNFIKEHEQKLSNLSIREGMKVIKRFESSR